MYERVRERERGRERERESGSECQGCHGVHGWRSAHVGRMRNDSMNNGDGLVSTSLSQGVVNEREGEAGAW